VNLSEFTHIQLSVYEWASVLHLATKWDFAAVRTLATSRIAELATPVDKIALARTHGISHWLHDAYMVMCGRIEPLTLDEARQLPLEDVVKISEARQAARGGILPTKLKVAVEEVLGLSTSAVPSKNPKHRSKAPTSDVTANTLLPITEVLETVQRNLAVFEEESDATIQEQGIKEIADVVKQSDNKVPTIRRVMELIVNKGIGTWSDSDTCNADTSPYVRTLNEIAKVAGDQFGDGTFADSSGNPINGRAVIRCHIAQLCCEHVPYEAINDRREVPLAIKQAGFSAQLFAKDLVSSDHLGGWWNAVPRNPNGYLVFSLALARNFHAFLSSVGRAIDVPSTSGYISTFFNYWQSSSYYLDGAWSLAQPEIQVSRINILYLLSVI
jgi:hypothetical protein